MKNVVHFVCPHETQQSREEVLSFGNDVLEAKDIIF